MADERDPKISKRYRELGAEAPPRHIDEAILAASRRAAEVHPAPLVPPTGRRRWYFPLAAAAVIVLSVAVTWHMRVAEPDPYGYVASAPAPQAPAEQKAEVQVAPAAKPFTPDPRLSRDQARRDAPARVEPKPQAAPPLAGSRMEERALGKVSEVEPPEKWLERIAELRKEGSHEEADKALEEFRKRYPDHKIPESVLRLPE